MSDSCFYPADKSNCKTGWIIDESKAVGSGANGKAYSACCKEKCSYIAKHVILVRDNLSKEERNHNFEEEVRLLQDVAKLGLAPMVIDYWSCDHGGMIVMERLTTTLKDIIDILYRTKPILIYILIRHLISNVFVLHQNNVCHSDLHLHNVMLNFNSIKSIQFGEYELKFIDLGESFNIRTESDMGGFTLIEKATCKKQCIDGYSIFRDLREDIWYKLSRNNYASDNKNDYDVKYGDCHTKGDYYVKLSMVLLYDTFKLTTDKPKISNDDKLAFGFELEDFQKSKKGKGLRLDLSKDYRFKPDEFESAKSPKIIIDKYPPRSSVFEDSDSGEEDSDDEFLKDLQSKIKR